MNVTPAIQKLIVSILILAGLGYVLINTLTGEIPVDETVVNTKAEGEEMLILADKLDAVNINDSIFSSPLFTSLVDISVPIVEELKGRPNPFSQIGNDSVSTGPGSVR
jgi:hypothetical protein